MNNHDVIAISGGTSGIGRAVLERCVQNNTVAAFSGRRMDAIRDLEASLGSGTVAGLCCDAAEPDHIVQLFALAKKRFSQQPTAFVLCAGRGLPGSLTTSDPCLWDELLRVNVLAAMHQLRGAAHAFTNQTASDVLPHVRDIVVIGSTVGRNISAANPIYGATKFALHSLVESLRQELCKKLIRVTLIEPGFVKTGFQAAAGYDMDWFNKIEREQGPFLSADDVASVIEFACGLPAHMHMDDVRVRPTRQTI